MLQAQTKTLKTILSEVLADLAFLLTDEEEADQITHEQWLETTVGYQGRFSGELVFHCPMEFARLLSGNLLGLDPTSEEADQAAPDAVKEFMNILCGQLVTTWHGTHDVFDVSIPQACVLDDVPGHLNLDDENTCKLSVEGLLVHLEYYNI